MPSSVWATTLTEARDHTTQEHWKPLTATQPVWLIRSVAAAASAWPLGLNVVIIVVAVAGVAAAGSIIAALVLDEHGHGHSHGSAAGSQGTTRNLNMRRQRHLPRTIAPVEGVETVHDLHVWSLSSEVRALSAHLVLAGHPDLEEAQVVGTAVKRAISRPFSIAHATFELECESFVDDGSWRAIDSGPRTRSAQPRPVVGGLTLGVSLVDGSALAS